VSRALKGKSAGRRFPVYLVPPVACVAAVGVYLGVGHSPAPSDGPDGKAPQVRREPPGPADTGVPGGVALTPGGTMTINEAGRLVEGLDIDGPVVIAADDVTLRRSRVTTGDYWAVKVMPGHTGVVVEDVEIDGQEGCDAGLGGLEGSAFTARRVNIHGCADGVKAGNDTLIEGSWIHDMRVVAPGPDGRPEGSHNDGVQVSGPLHNLTIRGNNFQNVGTNSSIQAKNDFGGGIDGLLIEGNWMEGGGYALYVWDSSQVTVRDNRFRRNAAYGIASLLHNPGPLVQSGNVWDDDGRPVTL
jgi:hypothetical protein